VPAFTVITVKTALLDSRPWLAEALCDGFTTARANGVEPSPGVAKIVDGDPVPIGLSANRASFEELLGLGHQQKILTTPLTVDDLFPALG
jgi:4,5-dihydroxyphthalate decarboxylase